MTAIQLLPDSLINKIAAGEVVERPASILKELVENSVDAGASRVEVEVEGGGKSRIRVVDDGCGMDLDDALMAFERHATSKIKQIEDLDQLVTLGFRGEALPSIAAVSRVVLTTRPPAVATGTRVEVEGGRIVSSGETGCPIGTSIDVSRLFYNVPARRKFLRSTATETAHIQETFLGEALGHPGIFFSLSLNGKQAALAPAVDDRIKRAGILLGEGYLDRMAFFRSSRGDVQVEGFLSNPGFEFSSWEHVRLFVNNRPVNSPLIYKVVGKVFSPYAKPGKKPAALIWLTLSGDQVDVNVHPTKREVRFRSGNEISSILEEALGEVLRPHHPPKTLSEVRVGMFPMVSQPLPIGVRSSGVDYLSPRPEEVSQPSSPVEAAPAVDLFLFREEYRVIGQWFRTYIVLGSDRGLYLVDQHVAHERILFEKVLKNIGRGLPAQNLLTPIIIDLPPSRIPLLETAGGLLSRLGVEAEAAGPGQIAVRSVPFDVPPEEVAALIGDLLSLSSDEVFDAVSETAKKAAARLACAGAVKAGQSLNPSEMEALCRDLGETGNPYRCPHGRPIVLFFPRGKIESGFMRR